MTPPEGELARRQIRGSSLLLTGQTFAVLAGLAAQVVIVRYLSEEGYGAFAYALSIAMIGESVAAFGMRRGVSRFLPIYEEQGDLRKAAGTLLFAIATVLALGLAVVLSVISFRGAIAGTFADDSTAVTVIAIMIALAPIQALNALLDGVFAVFSRPRAIVIRRFLLTPLLRLGVVVVLAAREADLEVLAVGYVAAAGLGLLLYVPMLAGVLKHHGFTGHLRRGGFEVPARTVLGFTVPLLSNDITAALLNAANAIVLGIFATPEAVAELRSVLPLALTMGYVLSSFGLLFVPLAARLFARSEPRELNQLYWRTAVWTTVLAFPIFLTCLTLAEPLTVLLFGERYASAAPVLAVLAVGQFVNTAAGHNGVLLGVFGRVRFIAATNVLAIAANLILLLLLVPPYEAIGAAVATAATFVVLNAIRQVGLARRTDVSSLNREVLPTYAAIVAATAAVGAIDLALSPPVGIEIALVVLASASVGFVARRSLALEDTFPELARLPLLRTLLGARKTGG